MSIPDAATAAGEAAPDLDFSAISTICDNDPQAIRHLRASVAVIARRTDDPALRELALQVLKGQTSFRRLAEHPTFGAMASRSADNLAEGLSRLDDDVREKLMSRIGERYTSEETEFALMESRPVERDEDGRPTR